MVPLDTILYLNTCGSIACDASFSNTLVRGRCRGWLSSQKASWQEFMMVLSRPDSHITWRLFSDFTRDWIWSTRAHWISWESWNGHRSKVRGLELNCTWQLIYPILIWFSVVKSLSVNIWSRKEAPKARGSSRTAWLFYQALPLNTVHLFIWEAAWPSTAQFSCLNSMVVKEENNQLSFKNEGPPQRAGYKA